MPRMPKDHLDPSARRVQEIMQKAGEQDLRRQKQIQNQVEIINRLKNQLEESKDEIISTQMAIWYLVKTYGLDTTHGRTIFIPRHELEEAPVGAVEVEIDNDTDMVRVSVKEG